MVVSVHLNTNINEIRMFHSRIDYELNETMMDKRNNYYLFFYY